MELSRTMKRKFEALAEAGADEWYSLNKPTLKKATEMADYIFSAYIREKEPWCACCGRRDSLTCGHLFSRIFISLRWDEDNAATQCAGCNMKHEHHPELYRRIMVTRLGEEKVAAMWDRRLDGKYPAIERIRIAEKYYQKFLELK